MCFFFLAYYIIIITLCVVWETRATPTKGKIWEEADCSTWITATIYSNFCMDQGQISLVHDLDRNIFTFIWSYLTIVQDSDFGAACFELLLPSLPRRQRLSARGNSLTLMTFLWNNLFFFLSCFELLLLLFSYWTAWEKISIKHLSLSLVGMMNNGSMDVSFGHL